MRKAVKEIGIDVYLRWEEQTKEERAAQITGFSPAHGHVGYLREAYHGGPYATKVLVPETWESDDGTAYIPSQLLKQRLSHAIKTAIERERVVYGDEDADETLPMVQSLKDFVALYEMLELAGKHPHVLNSY